MGKVRIEHEGSTPDPPDSGNSLLYATSEGLWAQKADGVTLFLGPFNVTEVTGDYTVEENDGLIIVDASGAAVTITLPPGRFGTPFKIKAVDATNTVTVEGDGSDTIDGSGSFTLGTGEISELWWDGSEWREAAAA